MVLRLALVNGISVSQFKFRVKLKITGQATKHQLGLPRPNYRIA